MNEAEGMLSFSRALAAAALIAISATPARSQGVKILTLYGKCDASSHIAEGPRGADLRKLESRFFCDAAVVSYGRGESMMVQFANSRANHSPIVGFAGRMGEGGVMDVDRVYLEPGKPLPVTEGTCKFSFKGARVDWITCGAPIDEGAMRTVPVVVFTTTPR
jgi:hypothetical protein